MSLLQVLERIALAVEAQAEALDRVTQSNLMLLEELTNAPDEGSDAEPSQGTYLDGKPR